MKLSSKELRETFLSFFREKAHVICPGAPLTASGDPTLLFTAAGMVQFKEYYSSDAPPFTRAASIQKCLRLSDLENVGRTVRHHTFFEMLGNFSFGDYFKEEAIAWGWDFATRVLCLPQDRLWVSVYEEDDEARGIWEKKIGLPDSRVVSLGKKDNFWGPVGRTGVCGPCSEIYIDLLPQVAGQARASEDVFAKPRPVESSFNKTAAGLPTAIELDLGRNRPALPGTWCGREDCKPGCECERFLEFWNLVFPQFYKEEDGTLSRLKKTGIDTGMGLERLAMIVQGKGSVFETDLLKPLVDTIEELLERGINRETEEGVSANVVADHLRSLAFGFAEGIVPSNEGRGYVLRRLLRRASRRMKMLGAKKPLLYRLVGVVTDVMRDYYPELSQKREHVARLTKSEEERFERTLELGISRFEELADKLQASGEKRFPGRDVFTLYDTYGFPPDLTEEMAREKGLEIDSSGFEEEMERQRRTAKEKSRFHLVGSGGFEISGTGSPGGSKPWETLSTGAHSRFVGHAKLSETVNVRKFRHVWAEGKESIQVILDRTPFYAEAGGQVSDRGSLSSGDSLIEVTGAFFSGKAIVHEGKLLRGTVGGGPYTATVDAERRLSVARNHTATHLLHGALRKVLGDHVRQAGSLVAPDRLRFDYTHFQAPSSSELEEVEELTNRLVVEDIPVSCKISSYEEALSTGAMALFGEKYGKKVRLVAVGEASKELCGGTHVERTGQVGHFLIVSESAIGSGARRIEAVTGQDARAQIVERGRALSSIRELVGVGQADLLSAVSALIRDRETLRKKTDLDEKTGVVQEVERLVSSAEEVSGAKVVVARVSIKSQDMMRAAGDLLRERLKQGAGVIATELDGKGFLLAFVGDSLLSEGRILAGDIAREAARAVGGGGGGKPHMATAGVRDALSLERAVARGREFIIEKLRG
ncbi:MAG: alanine--tRNA ligase [Candidatus Eisenbacteria bacterium]|nr:alanine--tRNA ligase [Candidatus Eisenbacteria bacterium]